MKRDIYLNKVVINFGTLSEPWASETELVSIIFIVLLKYNIQN